MIVILSFATGLGLGALLVKQPKVGVEIVNAIVEKVPSLAPIFNRKG